LGWGCHSRAKIVPVTLHILKTANVPIGVGATYSFDENLPESIRLMLPPPDEIAKVARGFDSRSGLFGVIMSIMKPLIEGRRL